MLIHTLDCARRALSCRRGRGYSEYLSVDSLNLANASSNLLIYASETCEINAAEEIWGHNTNFNLSL